MTDKLNSIQRLQKWLAKFSPRFVAVAASFLFFTAAAAYWATYNSWGSHWSASPRLAMGASIALLLLARLLKPKASNEDARFPAWTLFAAVAILSTVEVFLLGTHAVFYLYPALLILAAFRASNGLWSPWVLTLLALAAAAPGPLEGQSLDDEAFWRAVRESDREFSAMIGSWVASHSPQFVVHDSPTYHELYDLYLVSAADAFPVAPVPRLANSSPGNPVGVMITSHQFTEDPRPYVVERAVVYAYETPQRDVRLECRRYPTRAGMCEITVDPQTREVSAFSFDTLWDQYRDRTTGPASRSCVLERARGVLQQCETVLSQCVVVRLMRANDDCRGVGPR